MRALILLLLGLAASACNDREDRGGLPTPSAVDPVAQGDVSWPSSVGLETLRAHLHADRSGPEARELFPDLTETYVDDGRGIHGLHNPAIVPFRYYWSPSGRFTVSICAIGKTVLICPYYLDHLITTAEFPNCDVSFAYAGPELAPAPTPTPPPPGAH